ncbi:hypothetical protein BDAP_001983 [Binucleata daphniae]
MVFEQTNVFSISSGPTMASAVGSPFKYSGLPHEDISTFLDELTQYTHVHKLTELQTTYLFKLSLHGEAKTWVRGMPDDMALQPLISSMVTRFQSRNTQLFYIKKLLHACQQTEKTSLLSLLDELKIIAKKGEIPEDVVTTMALTALSDDWEGRICTTQTPGKKLDFNELYRIATIYKNLKPQNNKHYNDSEAFKITTTKNNEHKLNEKWCHLHDTSSHGMSQCYAFSKFKKRFNERKKEYNTEKSVLVCEVDQNEIKKNLNYTTLTFQNNFIIYTKLDKLTYKLKTLVDTGSQITILHYKYKNAFSKSYKTDIRIITANNTQLTNSKYVYGQITINNCKFSATKIYLADLKNYDMIIGSNFILQHFDIIKLQNVKPSKELQTIETKEDVGCLFNPITQKPEVFEKGGGLGSQPPSGDSWATLD